MTRQETVIWDWSAYEKQYQYAKLGTYAAHVGEKEIITDRLQAAYVAKILQPPKILQPHSNLLEAVLMKNEVVIVFREQFTPQETVFKNQPRTLLAEKIIKSKDSDNVRF